VEDLRGKTVLLTGASTGLGPHIARRLQRAGAKFVLSARNQEALKRLAEELGGARVVVADLSRLGEAERLAREAGDVDVLVSNAGMPASGRLATFKVAEVDRAIAVNLRAGMVLAHQLVPAMLNRKGGHLVFMSSLAGIVPAAGNTVSVSRPERSNKPGSAPVDASSATVCTPLTNCLPAGDCRNVTSSVDEPNLSMSFACRSA